jgi:HK97 family phage portal protein
MASWSINLGFFRYNSGGDTRHTGTQTPLPAKTGKQAAPVTFDSAMQVSAFWASVRLLTETVAAMPLRSYMIDDESGVKQPQPDYELFKILNYRPNRYQTRIEFFESVMLNLVTWGNSYCTIQRDANGNIIQLLPLMASQMEVKLLGDGSTTYHYTTADNTTRVYASETVWHIKLFGNGIVGMSPLGYARNALGIATALEQRVSTLAANGGRTTGVLMVDDKLTPEQRAQIRKNYAGLEEGTEDQLFILETNMKYVQTSLSPSDVQMIENRRFEVEDIARFMGVPSVLINDTSASTAWGSGIEQINMGFYKLNLRPYLERIEASMKRWLIPEKDWDKIEIEFDFDSLLRADQATRLEGYSKAINSGQMTPDEARAKEGRGKTNGGDVTYLNSTLVPAGTSKEEDTDGNQTSQPTKV